jgi:hypothetical protein
VNFAGNAPVQYACWFGALVFVKKWYMFKYRIALLRIAGIETNPGPRPPKYPCGICSNACKWGEKALACDECDTWYHVCVAFSVSSNNIKPKFSWKDFSISSVFC